MTNTPTRAYRWRRTTRQHRWVEPVLFTVGAIVLLLIGVGVGAAGSSQASLVASQKAQITRLQAKVSTEQADVTSEQNKLTVTQQTAQGAVSMANAAAAGKYASGESAVQRMQRKLSRELGVVAKSTISAPGVYVVGKDIPAGTYHTSGDGGTSGVGCNYATLGSTDTNNILDNNNFDSPETVSLGGVYAFQINGDCTWHKAG